MILTDEEYHALCAALDMHEQSHPSALAEAARMQRAAMFRARKERDDACFARDAIQRDANIALDERRAAQAELRTAREQLAARTAELDDVRELVGQLADRLGVSW